MATTSVKEPSNSERIDAIDKAQMSALKLHALLCNTFGESGPSFRGLSDEIQDAYMWTCADLVADLTTALDSLTPSGQSASPWAAHQTQ